jgi:putative aldouronate transport system substrate-binding protein
MKKGLKPISIALAMALSVTAIFTGCKTNKPTTPTDTSGAFSPDISKEVKIRYYHIGGKSAQEDEVLANLNTKLKAKINATLEVNYLSWGDAWTKGPLLFASGEDFDMIFCSPWFLFGDQGKKGAYKELDDILPKYAPKIWKEAPSEAWKQASIDGKIYAIPQYEANNTSFYGIGYREDLRKKYNVPEIKKVTDFEAFFDAIKKNEPKIIPWAASDSEYPNMLNMYIRENTNLTYQGIEDYGFMYDMTSASPKVIFNAMVPQVDEWAVIAKRWADAGYWSQNALSNKTHSNDAYKAGTSAVSNHETYGINDSYKGLKQNNPNADSGFYINLSKDGKTDRRPYFSNGVAINANSKNPERAVMLVEALMYDPEIYEAGVFGIEGKTFVKDANGNYAVMPGAKPESSWGFGNMYGMGITNYKMEKKDTSTDHPLFISKYWNKEYHNKYAVDCALVGFVLDATTINAEMAAIKDLQMIYGPIISLGLSKDPAATLKEYRDKLQKAGLEKVTAEMQKQVDAFVAKK